MRRYQPPPGPLDQAIDWVRAIALGIRDTAEFALKRGREGASEAYEERWRRFDEKTKRVHVIGSRRHKP